MSKSNRRLRQTAENFPLGIEKTKLTPARRALLAVTVGATLLGCAREQKQVSSTTAPHSTTLSVRDLSLQKSLKEQEHRRRFLEVNNAKELAEVHTDSGITLKFYSPGHEEPTQIYAKGVNSLVNYSIAMLSELKQDYMPQDDVRDMQQRAKLGQLNNVNMTVMLCSDSYFVDVAGSLPAKKQCGADGFVSGQQGGYREGQAGYNPTMMISSWIRQKTDMSGAQHAANSIPSSTTSDFVNPETQQQLQRGKYSDRDQVMTSLFVHEFSHLLVYLGTNSSQYQSQDPEAAHKQIVSPIQRLSELLMTGSPGFKNPTPYDVTVSFGIAGDPVGPDRDQYLATNGGQLYYQPTP